MYCVLGIFGDNHHFDVMIRMNEMHIFHLNRFINIFAL